MTSNPSAAPPAEQTPYAETDSTALGDALAAAAAAFEPLAHTPLAVRAAALRAVADALDAATDELVALAADETAMALPRLSGELARTTAQCRMFADGVEDGSWMDIIIDTADPQVRPVARPDLRRMQLPLGPVLVFAASNFPFAFSVAGGDTASALAVGCPVVVKAHPGHPKTSDRTAAVVLAALDDSGLPRGSLAVVHGQETGVTALLDPRIRAGSFTGSLHGGRALADLAAGRDDPIPFFAEMGSLNPVFVTPAAVAERGTSITEGYVSSFTLGVGQFCTKPGLLFLPRGHGLENDLVAAVGASTGGRMLMRRIHEGHELGLRELSGLPGVRVLAQGAKDGADDGRVVATLLATDVPALLSLGERLLTECFGPTSIVVEYDGEAEALSAARAFRGNLTATVHAEPSETGFSRRLATELQERAGRLVWNGWPTGVAVTWAMHHGGPYPATNNIQHTSVGMTAARRFLRPICYQDWPQDLLPEALRDQNTTGIPRRVNGRVSSEDVASARASS